MSDTKLKAPATSPEARGSDASACDSRIAKPKEQWCLKGHSAICDTLCNLWCCKHEHQQALLAPRPNDKLTDGEQPPVTPKLKPN